MKINMLSYRRIAIVILFFNSPFTYAQNKIFEIVDIKAITSENYFTTPTWSPDGKKIALTKLDFKGIYLTNMDDNTHKWITDEDGAGFRFSWSPDSKEIVYMSRKFGDRESNNSIRIVNIKTGIITDLTTGKNGVSMPSYTKTRGIVYSDKGNLIFRGVEIDKSTFKKTFSLEKVVAEYSPANIIIETPTEDKLIIEDDEGIKIIDSNGKNRKTIVKNGEDDFACDAKVSPDGSKVLFYNNVKSVGHLYIYEINNGNIFDLGEGYFGQWLPDDKIIYCITTDDGSIITGSELYLINANGTNKRKLTNTENQIEIQPAVSPDGRTILYRDDKSGNIFSGELINEK